MTSASIGQSEGFAPGLIAVDKPKDMTSSQVVQYFKTRLPRNVKKIGHFGTLDPFATGLLVIGHGGACRLNDLIHQKLEKRYRAIGILGHSTETGDCDQNRNLNLDQFDTGAFFKKTLPSYKKDFLQNLWQTLFLGDYRQAPHSFSAAKFQGRKLHEWARSGIKIQKEKKTRQISYFKVLSFNFPLVEFEVEVSSGTYIRGLFEDMAKSLGTLGHLQELRRVSLGNIEVENALQREDWDSFLTDSFQSKLSVSSTVSPFGFLPLPLQHLSVGQGQCFRHGQKTKVEMAQDIEFCWVLGESGGPLGVGRQESQGYLTPVINFSRPFSLPSPMQLSSSL